jgi:hypothetical protein
MSTAYMSAVRNSDLISTTNEPDDELPGPVTKLPLLGVVEQVDPAALPHP